MDPHIGRVRPSDLDAEGAVLSACLLDSSAVDRVQLILHPRHFYADANRLIYEAIVELSKTGTPVDVVSVAGWLRDKERLQFVGGSPYLARLSDAIPAVAHVEHHAQVIVDKWSVRQVIETCSAVATEGYGDIGTVSDWLQEVDSRIHATTRRETPDKHIAMLGVAAAEETMRIAERKQAGGALVTGITTGLPTLDVRLRGLQRGCKYVIAARPGVGKTSAGMGIALAAAADGHPVVFFSLEMPRDQLALRALSQQANIDSQKLATGKISDEQFKELTNACVVLGKLPMIVFDQSSQTVSSLRAGVREARRELQERFPKLDPAKTLLVVVDFLQIMSAGEWATGNENTDLTNITLGTARLAKDEDCVVLELSQLNRALEKRARDERRPNLSDLRGAGAIEENTFSVIFLYRDDMYKKHGEDRDNLAEFIVAKVRGNPTGTVVTKFKASTTTFYEASRNPDYEQLGDIFDDYLPGTYGEIANPQPPRTWHDDQDR